MANQATINQPVSPERQIGRIKRLREAIQKANAKGSADKVVSLQAELDRRLEEVRAMRAALAEADAE